MTAFPHVPHASDLEQGRLRVVWLSLGENAPRLLEVVADGQGSVTLIATAEPSNSIKASSAAVSAIALASKAAEQCVPLHETAVLISDLVDSQLCISIVRLSPIEQRIELLIAGMVPVLCCTSHEPLRVYPALAPGIHPRSNKICPVQWLALTAPAHWIVCANRGNGESEISDALHNLAAWLKSLDRAPTAAELLTHAASLEAVAVASYGFS